MATYRLTGGACVIKDGVSIVGTADTPENPNTNADYAAYKTWLAAGGVPDPWVPSTVEAAAIALQTADSDAITTAKANAVIQYLVVHTPAQCIAKVNTDVVDLASAKVMLGHFAVALCVLSRNQLR